MDIYDVDFNQQAPEILPPDKRDDSRVTLMQSLMSALQWCRDLILGSYKKGSTDPEYAAGTYPAYAKVIFEKAVYYSLIDDNTASPLDATAWLKIQDNFLGVGERVKFNGQNLILEYALNQRFSGTFRPPGSMSNSDIYMTMLPRIIYGFLVGQSIGSAVGQTQSEDKIGTPIPFRRINNFEVHVTNAIFTETNEQEIRDFINLYIPASLKFIITTY